MWRPALRPTTHSGRPPIDRRASVRGTRRRARRAADRRRAEIGVLVVMVFWAGNFIVVKATIGVLPPMGSRSSGSRWRRRPARAPPLARGHAPAPARASWRRWRSSASSGSACTRCCGPPRSPDHGGRFGAAHRRDTGLHCADRGRFGSDTLTRPKLVGAWSPSPVSVVIGAGAGLELRRRRRRLSPDAARRRSAGRSYSAFGGPVLRRRSPFVLTAWAIARRHGSSSRRSRLGQLPARRGLDRSAVAVPIVLAVALLGCAVRGARQRRGLQWVRPLGPTRVTALQSLVPALAVVLASIFLGEPIRLGQVVGGAIIVSGVALTRHRRHRGGPRVRRRR